MFQSPFMMKTMKSDQEHPLLHPPFLVFQKSSSVSVVFDFNASLIDALPASPMLLSVDLMENGKKSGLLMDAICVLFLLCLPSKLSSMSVVFDFNASLSDVAPLSPILLSVCFDEN